MVFFLIALSSLILYHFSAHFIVSKYHQREMIDRQSTKIFATKAMIGTVDYMKITQSADQT